MAAFLCALTADGGLPLFTRKTGDLEPLSFAALGPLNGVHMYTRLREAELLSASTPEEKLMWKVYHDSVVLILITRNDACSNSHLSVLLDNIFAAMVMLVGLDNLCNMGNIEKLKRELKSSYPLINYLLNQMDAENLTMGDLTQKVDVLLSHESQSLQSFMSKFLETVDCIYGCLLVKGKIVVASKEWFTLGSQELVLISAFVNSLTKSPSSDKPIYLPNSCPRTCSRLLILQLLRGVELCILCSNVPSLSYVEEEAPKIWKGSFELLKMVLSLHPRNFPTNILLDRNIEGVLLINQELNQTVCSVCPVADDSLRPVTTQPISFPVRLDALRTVYKLVVGTYFNEEKCSQRAKAENNSCCDKPGYHNDCQVKEFYFCNESHKCYTIWDPPYQIFLIFNCSIPYYALRSVAHKTLKSLTLKKLMLGNLMV